MSSDARISVSLPSHPKIKKLIRRTGGDGAWRLVCLFLWAASNRSDGDLSGLTIEDIELAVDWGGEQGAFVRELVAVGFLDGAEGEYSIHDWAEHNPWAAGSEARSEKGKWAALCKQYGRTEAARLMPEYAARLQSAPSAPPQALPPAAPSMPDALPDAANGVPLAPSGSAPYPYPSPIPSPSPTPLPSPIPEPPPPPTGGVRRRNHAAGLESMAGFDPFYAAYPRKVGKKAALKAWVKLAPDEALQAQILGALAAQRPHLDLRDDKKYIAHPSTWLNEGRWDDELPGGKSAPAAADSSAWFRLAGFEHVAEAQNARCHIGNFRDFRDGKRVTPEVIA